MSSSTRTPRRPRRLEPRPAPGPMTRAELTELAPTCTRRGCPTAPVVELQLSTGGRPWYGCPEHRGALEAALYVGLPGATSGGSFVTVRELKP